MGYFVPKDIARLEVGGESEHEITYFDVSINKKL